MLALIGVGILIILGVVAWMGIPIGIMYLLNNWLHLGLDEFSTLIRFTVAQMAILLLIGFGLGALAKVAGGFGRFVMFILMVAIQYWVLIQFSLHFANINDKLLFLIIFWGLQAILLVFG